MPNPAIIKPAINKTGRKSGIEQAFIGCCHIKKMTSYLNRLAYNMYTEYMQGMITKHEDLLGTLVHDVAHLLRHDIDNRLKAYNLTRVKWLALGIIEQAPNITQKELADEMELGSASVGRLVDRLEERGFITRGPALDDRRAKCLNLKPQAFKLLGELRGVANTLREEVLCGLDANEVESVNSGLLKIKQNLKGLLTTSFITMASLALEINLAIGEVNSAGAIVII